MSKSIKAGLIGVVVLVLWNAISFIAPFKRVDAFWIGFAFMNLSIIVLIVTVLKDCTSPKPLSRRVLGWPLIYVATGYFVIQLIVSLIVMILQVKMWLAALLCAIPFGFALIGLISGSIVSTVVDEQDTVVRQKVVFVKSLSEELDALACSSPNQDLSSSLRKLSEAFRFSDPMSHSSLFDLEEQIQQTFVILKNAVDNGKYDEAHSIATKLNSLLEQRNRQTQLLK